MFISSGPSLQLINTILLMFAPIILILIFVAIFIIMRKVRKEFIKHR